jgi:hypothetical protein
MNKATLLGYGLAGLGVVLALAFSGALGQIFLAVLTFAVLIAAHKRKEDSEEEFEGHQLFSTPIEWAKPQQEKRKPNLCWGAAQYPIIRLESDGVWRENWDEQKGLRCLLFHFSNNLYPDNSGTPAENVRAQVWWEYDNGVAGAQLLPACWVEEKCGAVDIPVGVAKRLLIGTRSVDGCWYGWANSRISLNGEPQTRQCSDLPSAGKMHIRLIGESNEVWCGLDFEWECPFGPYHPKWKVISAV